MKNIFQVGDIIRGVKGVPYAFTDEKMEAGRVIKTDSDGTFTVKITSYPSRPGEIGEVYYGLDPQYFELIRHSEMKPFNRLEALAALAKDKSALLDYDLSSADLSGSNGIMSAIAFMDAHFERTPDGFIAYKTFGSSYSPNSDWKIEPGSVLTEVVNPDRTCDCGCGINVVPLSWVKDNATTNGGRLSIWKVLIRWEWLMGVVVPFGSDGKVRCEKVELIEVVK